MLICIPPRIAEVFKKGLIDRTIDPERLSQMTSKERHDFLATIVGKENALGVNALFESKLLLKHQQLGMISWAKKTLGLSPVAKRDIISRIERLDKVLDPVDEKAFLEDLASQKIGTGITFDEAKNITELSKVITQTRTAMETGGDRMDYGRASVALINYVSALKEQTAGETLRGYIRNPIQLLTDTAGVAKSMKASFDNSAIFRQGWKTLMTNPGIWLRNARKSFVDMWKEFKGKSVMDEVNADAISRKNYQLYKNERLPIGTIEEAYPSQLPEKIPVFRRLYKASQSAFTAFVYRQRMDVFDKYVEIAEKSGGEITGLGRLVGSLTGRGELGRIEPIANVVNNVFFSPRFLKSQFDVLTAHTFDRTISPFVRKQAAINLLKIISGTAAILTIANAVRPGSVEKDPRSADFGKIRIGDTRFDMTGGMASLITLAARMISNSSKSSTTGKVTELGAGGYGDSTRMDVLYNFFENKFSPAASVVKDLMKGSDFQGNKVSFLGETNNLLTPIPITTGIELANNPNSANIVISMIADVLGISTNTYSASAVNWALSTSKELQQFHERFGDTKFKEANDKYNLQFNEWFKQTSLKPTYLKLSNEEQQKVISGKKTEIRDKILKGYGFHYKQEKTKKLPKF